MLLVFSRMTDTFSKVLRCDHELELQDKLYDELRRGRRLQNRSGR